RRCVRQLADARDATTKIPIVFMFVPDPVGMKLVQSIARPGGNITGLSNFGRDVAGKRLQLLKEIVPDLSRVALLINSDQPTTPVFVGVMRATADQLGLVLQTFDALTRGNRAGVRRNGEGRHAGDHDRSGRAFLSSTSFCSQIGNCTSAADVGLFTRNL